MTDPVLVKIKGAQYIRLDIHHKLKAKLRIQKTEINRMHSAIRRMKGKMEWEK